MRFHESRKHLTLALLVKEFTVQLLLRYCHMLLAAWQYSIVRLQLDLHEQ